MKRLLTFMVLAVLLVPSISNGQDHGEYKFTGTGGFRIASVFAVGQDIVWARSDGDATILIVDTITAAPTVTIRREWPSGVIGLAAWLLRDSSAREFDVQGADSVYVDIGTSTEVIVSW